MWTDTELVHDLVLAIIAVSNFLTALVVYLNHKSMKTVKEDMATVKFNTNSMKDELVKASGDAGETRGFAAGQKAEQEANKKD